MPAPDSRHRSDLHVPTGATRVPPFRFTYRHLSEGSPEISDGKVALWRLGGTSASPDWFATTLTAYDADGNVHPDADEVSSTDMLGHIVVDDLVTASRSLGDKSIEVVWDGTALTVDIEEAEGGRRHLVAHPLSKAQASFAEIYSRLLDDPWDLMETPATVALRYPDEVAALVTSFDISHPIFSGSGIVDWDDPDHLDDEGEGTGREMCEAADKLVAAGVEHLDAARFASLLKLAHGWTGTVEDLLHVAAQLELVHAA